MSSPQNSNVRPSDKYRGRVETRGFDKRAVESVCFAIFSTFVFFFQNLQTPPGSVITAKTIPYSDNWRNNVANNNNCTVKSNMFLFHQNNNIQQFLSEEKNVLEFYLTRLISMSYRRPRFLIPKYHVWVYNRIYKKNNRDFNMSSGGRGSSNFYQTDPRPPKRTDVYLYANDTSHNKINYTSKRFNSKKK